MSIDVQGMSSVARLLWPSSVDVNDDKSPDTCSASIVSYCKPDYGKSRQLIYSPDNLLTRSIANLYKSLVIVLSLKSKINL